jgi:hypothetical protein
MGQNQGRDWSLVNRGAGHGQIGRPPKAGRTRDKQVKIAFTAEELADVKALASAAGQPSLADYVRALIRADGAIRGAEVLVERRPGDIN